jgi:hypothetical protein
MSVYKPFLTEDVTVVPFKVNKSFTFEGLAAITGSGIDIFTGKHNPQPNLPWPSGSNPTGYNSIQHEYLIYDSIKELYYSNYLLSPSGSPADTASFNPDGTITGGSYTPSYYDYPSSTFLQTFNFDPGYNTIFSGSYTSTSFRYFPTSSGIVVISIPSNLFGEYIKPGSFKMGLDISSPPFEEKYLYDDGEGNVFYTEFGGTTYPLGYTGNIIYEHGLIILTLDESDEAHSFQIPFYPNVSCSFQSTTTIYESQYKCTIRENEFGFSQNPSLISGSSNSGVLSDFATGSYFNPYVTTVGLYNNNKELLAVAKLAQPLPLSDITDTNIMVNLDL